MLIGFRIRMRSSSVQLPFRRLTTSGFGPTKTLYVGEAVKEATKDKVDNSLVVTDEGRIVR